MNRIAISTLTAQNISGNPLLTYTYTADADRELLVQVSASGLAGNGSYGACLTRQIGGTGAAYQSPSALVPLANGVTTLTVLTTSLAVETGDVVKVYLAGQAADTSVSIVTEVFDVLSEVAAVKAVTDKLDTALEPDGAVYRLVASSAGAGSETVTIECLDASSLPLEGVAVWVTDDLAGSSIKAGTLYSNTLGRVTVYLDPGAYYVWRQGGANWSNPQSITVTDL